MIKSEYYKNTDIITPDDDAHYFFGYYDMRPYSKGRHLTLRVPFLDRIPEADDVAEIGYVKDKVFTPFASTTAWNFQQSAMLQWHPYLEDTVYYNEFVNGNCVTTTHNIATGEKKHTDRPTACISPDGKWGLSVNFARIYAFRPGYGYAACVDPNADVNQPTDDGVFLVDMETGRSKFLVDYVTLGRVGGFSPEDKILVNHITFNTDSSRYCMLVRNFGDPRTGWLTSLMVGDLNGNVRTILEKTYVSHYVWLDDDHLIAHCAAEPTDEEWNWSPSNSSMFCIDMTDGSYEKWDMPYFRLLPGGGDIHCNIIPGSDYVIGDGYPVNGLRYLLAYNRKTGAWRVLLRAKTLPPANTDVRCDLHARFIDGGKYITYDTTENGKRQIAMIDTSALDF